MGPISERNQQSGVRLYQRGRGLVLSVTEIQNTAKTIRVTELLLPCFRDEVEVHGHTAFP